MRNNTENPWFGSVQYLSVTVQYFFDTKKRNFNIFLFIYLSVYHPSIYIHSVYMFICINPYI